MEFHKSKYTVCELSLWKIFKLHVFVYITYSYNMATWVYPQLNVISAIHIYQARQKTDP